MAWNGERWLAIGSDLEDDTNTKIASSSDGITWYDASSSSISSNILQSGSCLAWNGSYWLAGGYGTEFTEQLPLTFTSIADGGYHSVAFTTNGEVYAWGRNYDGELGLGASVYGINQSSPVLITDLSNVSGIAAEIYYSLALTTNGKVYAWGKNNFGQLGLGYYNNNDEFRPVLITDLSNVSGIAAGDSHSLAFTTNGEEVYAWGG